MRNYKRRCAIQILEAIEESNGKGKLLILELIRIIGKLYTSCVNSNWLARNDGAMFISRGQDVYPLLRDEQSLQKLIIIACFGLPNQQSGFVPCDRSLNAL